MYLKNLDIVNYKNFDSSSFQFNSKINCFVGSNGVGKTTVLDAIYHLCFGKSYFNPVATQNIRHGTDFFMLDGLFEREGKDEKILCSLKRGQKRLIKRNGTEYERLSEHIGLFPLVIISPADRDLITEGSDTRRKLMDGIISQQNKPYLQMLLRYQKVVAQRNALLKYFTANHNFNQETLDIYNKQLSELGVPIYRIRKAFVEEFIPIFQKSYEAITKQAEEVQLVYQSQLEEEDMSKLLYQEQDRDRLLQFTTVGIHKDDLNFLISGHPIKRYGSQGQQKSYLIAIKLAQFDFLKTHSGIAPLLLLDDIFDKLDEHRVSQLLTLVRDDHFGQIFLSDTHPERTENLVKELHQSYSIIRL